MFNPKYEHSRSSIEFLNESLKQIGHGVYEFCSDIKKTDYY